MPAITDHFKSVDLVGWFGTAYLYSFGWTLPISLTLGEAALARQRIAGLFSFTILASLIFLAGQLCCFTISSPGGILIGRILSGIGASTMISSIVISYEAIMQSLKYKSGATRGLYHAILRFAGPM
jgi:MFS family permease